MNRDVPNVLVLGSGLVSRPIVRYFLDDEPCRLTVGSLEIQDARALIDDHPQGQAREVNVADPSQLEPLIHDADLVISFVPQNLHADVARCAIRHRVNMVTASYALPEMKELDHDARNAGITILNEVGLDPGLDHMSAMRMIDRARADGGTVTKFVSCGGALPAPEAANNPWKYKFSWSPRGALLAGRQSARYLERGTVIDIPGEELFSNYRPYEIEDLGQFEIYPNRDSMPYIKSYGLDDVQTMLRATIRYPGWCNTMKAVADLGLLDITPRSRAPGTSYSQFLEAFLPDGPAPLAERLARHLGTERDGPIVERFEWAGLLDEDALPDPDASPLDVVATRLAQRMKYRDEERDMVVLRHELRVTWPDRPDERRISLLVAFGEPGGDTATSRTVSLPAAAAGSLLLEGPLSPGVHIPTSKKIYEPILKRLESRGIAFREWNETD